jgi:hypothetical protein
MKYILYDCHFNQELKPRPWAADYQPPAPPDENSNVKKTPEEIEREIKVNPLPAATKGGGRGRKGEGEEW